MNVEEYLTSLTDARSRGPYRKQTRNMCSIMAETVREHNRSILSDCSSLCLTIDDKDPYRLVRFQAARLTTKGHVLVDRGLLGVAALMMILIIFVGVVIIVVTRP